MEVGDKDLYEYILNLADDKTTINMIRANPKVFDNEKFYEKVMRKRYPFLIEFRKENETWKELYLRMVYTLAKLQEKYQIPYIPTKGCNPEMLLKSSPRREVYDQALICAAAGGYVSLIDYFLEKGARDVNGALYSAGQHSNLDTVKYLISRGANNYNDLLLYAALGGKIDTMKFALDFLKLKGIDLNDSIGYTGRFSLQYAISSGHIEAVKFLIDNGMQIPPHYVQYAKSKHKYDIAEYLEKFL